MKHNFVILGDSYSTYEGFIPEGNKAYYSPTGCKPDHPVSIMDQKDTWWQRMMDATGANLVLNDSWSGSTICYTGYVGDCSMTSSFIYRYRKMRYAGLFEKNDIDTFIIFGGTNDSWVPAPLGEVKLSDWTEADLYNALPAMCYLLATAKRDLPNTRIVFVMNCGIRQEITSCIKMATEHFGIELVELHDIEKLTGHPTSLGMAQTCEQVMDVLAWETL